MKAISLLALSLAVPLAACDHPPTPEPPAASAVASASPPPATPSAAPATSTAAAARPKRVVPPRPLPKGQWGPVQPTAPLDVQQKTLAYTYAMATPDANDPDVDKTFVEQVVKKLEVAARTLDSGDRSKERVTATQGDRKIEVELGGGCTEKAPAKLIAKSGATREKFAEAGVFVVMCHDAKWKCFQSTREADDVLCVVAPRR